MLVVTSLGPQSAALLHTMESVRMPTYWISGEAPTKYQRKLIKRFRVIVTAPAGGRSKRELVEVLIREHSAKVWFTGIRRCQTPERAEMRSIERHLGAVRIAPLFEWSDEQVIEYLVKHGLPHEPFPDTKVECGLHTKEG
jgi:hypothetical protein